MEAGREQAGHPTPRGQLSTLRAPRTPWLLLATPLPSPQDIPADLALPWVQGLGDSRAGSRGEHPVGAASLPSPLSLV